MVIWAQKIRLSRRGEKMTAKPTSFGVALKTLLRQRKKPFWGGNRLLVFYRPCPAKSCRPHPAFACLSPSVPVYLFSGVRSCRLARPFALRRRWLGVVPATHPRAPNPPGSITDGNKRLFHEGFSLPYQQLSKFAGQEMNPVAGCLRPSIFVPCDAPPARLEKN